MFMLIPSWPCSKVRFVAPSVAASSRSQDGAKSDSGNVSRFADCDRLRSQSRSSDSVFRFYEKAVLRICPISIGLSTFRFLFKRQPLQYQEDQDLILGIHSRIFAGTADRSNRTRRRLV